MFYIFGTDQLFDPEDFFKLLSRLAVDLAFTWLIVGRIYARLYPQKRDFIFTYYVFNLITFSLCILLRKVPMELGFALGLFAVFGILRYRTEPIRLRDLTYMFIVIGIAILNALANKKISFAELIVVDLAIVAATARIELAPRRCADGQVPVLYDNLALLQPGLEPQLHADLARRTGLPIARVQIHKIDLLRDAAELTAFFPIAPSQDRAAPPPRDDDDDDD
jgi:hypothetical protein